MTITIIKGLRKTMQGMRQIICVCGLMMMSSSFYAQELKPSIMATSNQMTARPLLETPQYQAATSTAFMKHLDLSVNLGTTGIGLELATPIGKNVQLRTGFDYIPHFEYDMTFKVRVGDANDEDYDNDKLQKAKFDRLANMLEQFTGLRVDNRVEMLGEPSFYNFKLLVDVFPFHNKHWHLTGGFYAGASKIAKARNKMEDMPSLMAVSIYNNIYDKIASGEGIIFSIGGYDIPIFNDPELEDKILEYGRMGLYVGDMKADKSPYMMEPDENNLVRSIIKVNAFRPYVGFGYGGKFLKGDDRYNITFDCGVMMWGGTPKVLTHDGTDLAKEVVNIRHKVGDYVDLIKVFKAYPVLQVKLTRRLF